MCILKNRIMKNCLRHFIALSLSVLSFAAVSCSTIDLSGIENKLEQLESRVKALEEKVNLINTDLSSLKAIVNALQSNIAVTSVSQTDKGTVIVFANGVTATISDQEAPLIGVAQVDGIYYWTLNGEFILDEKGNRLPLTPDVKAPVIGVAEYQGVLYWTVNGEFILDEKGNKVPASGEHQGPAGDSIFKSVTVKDSVAVFVLANGTEFSLPLAQNAELSLDAESLYFTAGQQKSVKITTKNITGITVTEKPEGWRAVIVDDAELKITAPAEGAGDKEGYVVVLATSGSQTFIGKVYVSLGDKPAPGPDPDPEYNFSATVTGVDKAVINVSMGGRKFYAGLMLYSKDSEIEAKTAMFLEDAAAPLTDVGDGMYGKLIDQYSGELKMFVAPTDGDGKPSERLIIPGGKYLIALIPQVEGREASDYSISNVIIKTVILDEPQPTSIQLCKVEAGESSTNTCHANFFVTSSTSKFFYKVVKKSTLEKSGLSDYEYVMANGIKWDRAIVQAKGEVDFDDYENNLEPGTECVAIGIAFTSGGSYYMAKTTVSSDEIVPSSGTFSIESISKEEINANSVKVTFNYQVSENISSIRYFWVKASEYGESDEKAYNTLAAGARWDYDEIKAGDTLQEYIYPEEGDYVFYGVAVDNEKKYTTLVKEVFQVK